MGYKSLYVTWYGGEPLLNKNFVFSLSRKLIQFCRKEKIHYGAMAVTNGTILTHPIALKMKKLAINTIQITIDGPKEVHDSRRPFKNSSKSSFDTIIGNIEKIIGIIPVYIRINVDKTNSVKTLELLEYFQTKGFLDNPKDIYVYIGYTREWTSKCGNMASSCFSNKEFSEAELEFHKMLVSKGFSIGNMYPAPVRNYCSAAGPHGFVIDPGGGIHKCWSDVGDKDAYIGKLGEPLQLNGKFLKWLSYDPLTQIEECMDCKYFPICAGGCPYVMINQKEKIQNDTHYNCTSWKLLLEQKIKLFLEKKMSSETQKK